MPDRFPRLDPGHRRELLAPPDGLVDVVIDSDVTNEIDDQFALVWALLRPDRLRVRALTACPHAHGPELVREPGFLADLDRRRIEARLARRGLGPDVIPVRGPAEAVAAAEAELRSITVLTGADPGIVHAGADRFLPAPHEPVRSDAAEAIIETARQVDGPLHVTGIGAATNIASALLLEPSLVERIVVSWTAAYPTWWPRANASYNLALDVHAARVLLTSGVALVYLPGYYVGEELRVSAPELDAHLDRSSPVGAYLGELYAAHQGDFTRPGRSKVLWDLVNVAWLVDPDWLATDLVTAPDLEEDLRWRRRDEGGHEMREAYDIDRDAVVGDVFRTVRERGRSDDVATGSDRPRQ